MSIEFTPPPRSRFTYIIPRRIAVLLHRIVYAATCASYNINRSRFVYTAHDNIMNIYVIRRGTTLRQFENTEYASPERTKNANAAPCRRDRDYCGSDDADIVHR